MLVWAFVLCTCMLHKALIQTFVFRTCMLHKRGCTYLPGLLLYVHVCYIRALIRLRADQTDAHILAWAFVVCTCMLHNALIRLLGCTCLSGLLFYGHVYYIRR